MNSNQLLSKAILITSFLFLTSFMASVFGGLNRDSPYPLSVLKRYSLPEELSTHINFEKTIQVEGITHLTIRTISTDVAIKFEKTDQIHAHIDGLYGVDPAYPESVLTIEKQTDQLSLKTEEASPDHNRWFQMNMNFHPRSGKLILVVPDTITSIQLESVSGDLVATGPLKKITAKTVSGNIRIQFQHPDPEASLKSVSGDIYLMFHQKPDLALQFHTTSGDLQIKESYGALQKGSHALEVSTVSGDLKIE